MRIYPDSRSEPYLLRDWIGRTPVATIFSKALEVRFQFLWLLLAIVGFSSQPLLFAQGLDHPANIRAPIPTEEQSPSSSAIAGTLLDPSGAAIAKAQVSLLASDGKPLAQVATDSSGSFRFNNIPPGRTTSPPCRASSTTTPPGPTASRSSSTASRPTDPASLPPPFRK